MSAAYWADKVKWWYHDTQRRNTIHSLQ
jgi:hypothetical protein